MYVTKYKNRPPDLCLMNGNPMATYMARVLRGELKRDKTISNEEAIHIASSTLTGKPPYKGLGDTVHVQYSPRLYIKEPAPKFLPEFDKDAFKLKIGGRYSSKIVVTNVPVYISSMSTGALKVPFKLALHMAANRLYSEHGIRIVNNTGEGAALPWELYGREFQEGRLSKTKRQEILDMSYEILKVCGVNFTSGFIEDVLMRRDYYLSVQVASGRFWTTLDYLLLADMINWKGAQGAKIGHGGTVLAPKVDKVMELLRGIKQYTNAFSPSRHPTVLGPEDLNLDIWLLQEILQWELPILIKLGASRGRNDVTIVLKAPVDGVIIDGMTGGTGAAPVRVQHDIGIHTEPGVTLGMEAVNQYFERKHSNPKDENFVILASGGLNDANQIYKVGALGAHGAGLGTAYMAAAGCKLARSCHTPICPADLTGASKNSHKAGYSMLNIEKASTNMVDFTVKLARQLQAMKFQEASLDKIVTDDPVVSAFSYIEMFDGQTYEQKVRNLSQILLSDHNERRH